MVQIRRAAQRDADAIAKLAAVAAAEDGAATALDMERVRSHAFGSHALFECWLAEERPGKPPPVAHAVITKSYDLRRAIPTIVLCELFVAPSHRRAGVARLMMSAVAQRALDLGARELTITTGVGNAVAQKFFAAVGAKPQQAAVFVMPADGIQWLASEGR